MLAVHKPLRTYECGWPLRQVQHVSSRRACGAGTKPGLAAHPCPLLSSHQLALLKSSCPPPGLVPACLMGQRLLASFATSTHASALLKPVCLNTSPAQAYELMWELKHLFDPTMTINPGVVLNRDPDLHMKNLKTSPAASPIVDRCAQARCVICAALCAACDSTAPGSCLDHVLMPSPCASPMHASHRPVMRGGTSRFAKSRHLHNCLVHLGARAARACRKSG